MFLFPYAVTIDTSPSSVESAGVGIEDISVVRVESVLPKDGEGWFRALYVVVLSNKKRILVKMEKLHWAWGDYSHTMQKVKSAIHVKVEAMSIDLDTPCPKTFFSSDWPWKYMWLSMHHDVNKYWDSKIETKPIVQSNKYFIPLDVRMHPMRGDNNSAPKPLERCPGGVPPSHRYWLGVCGVKSREEGQEHNIFGRKCFLVADFG